MAVVKGRARTVRILDGREDGPWGVHLFVEWEKVDGYVRARGRKNRDQQGGI